MTLGVVAGLTDMLGDIDGVGDCVGNGVLLGLIDTDMLGVILGVTLIDGVIDGLTLMLGVILGVILMLGVMLGVILTLGVILGVTVGVGVTEGGNKLLVTEYVPQLSLLVIVTEVAPKGISTTIPFAKSCTLYPLPIRFTLS